MKTQFVHSPDGTLIAYDLVGSGPALMLLHGAGKTRLDWRKLGYVQRLQADFSVIAVDMRGSGESDQPVDIGEYAIDKICADLYAVADACGAPRFAVWGYSMGGNIARYLAAWSERITALAMIGVSFGPAVDREFDQYIDMFVKKYASGGQIAGQSAQAHPASKKQPGIKGQLLALAACFQAMRAWPDIQPEQVKCPALLLAGTRNARASGWAQANRAALAEANVALEIIQGLDHPQEFTQIEQVFPVIYGFLKERLA